MHDIDRTVKTLRTEDHENEFDDEFEDEFEDELEGEEPSDSEYDSEYDDEFEDAAPEPRRANPYQGVSEGEMMELATELLAVESDQELEQFIGSFLKKRFPIIGRISRSPAFRGFSKIFKPIAKRLLPIAGSALGSIVPGVGTAIGGALGSAAGRALGMELEGLSPEDQELEVAKGVVRLMDRTAHNIGRVSKKVPPQKVAHVAFKAAAQHLAPGILRKPPPHPQPRRPQYHRPVEPPARGFDHQGTWVRRGNKIILLRV